MKPPAVGYARPRDLAHALELLGGEDARVLAGGQSLGAALNLRLEAPELLVDVNALPDLDRIEDRGEEIAFGPLVRHRDVLESALVAQAVPLLALAMPHVAHPAIRNRGTTAGSLAYADPAAEVPAVAVALDAVIVLASAEGRREVPARAFFHGIYETARAPHEMIVEIRWPRAAPGDRHAFGEVTRRRGDFASVGFAARARIEGGVVAELDLVAFASEPAPTLLTAVAEVARGAAPDAALARALAAVATAALDPMPSLAGSPEVKRAQAQALAARVLGELFA